MTDPAASVGVTYRIQRTGTINATRVGCQARLTTSAYRPRAGFLLERGRRRELGRDQQRDNIEAVQAEAGRRGFLP
jgi:hypothetical protein